MSRPVSCFRCMFGFIRQYLLLIIACGGGLSALAAPPPHLHPLAVVPPMGWNDWAHYECDFTSQTILANARALVKTGLAARGYNTVVIDDCWMLKERNAHGDLQPDPQRFPQGIQTVAEAVRALGIRFGIYEDSGYLTCGKFAGSGVPNDGGRDHFVQDAALFKSWHVDYLKLDGCNVYVGPDETKKSAYRKAYAAQNTALKTVGRPTVFSESAPAYFQGTPDWYDVLTWVRDYGQLWREGTDIAVFEPGKPDADRFDSVLWNYAYNLPLGRFQKPGNWNDADFIIGGDSGMTLAETRSQLALWSMMSSPLILSSDIEKLSPGAIAILSNDAVIAVDQDPLGRMATLVRRSSASDILLKPLKDGDYAIAVLNRGDKPAHFALRPSEFGFTASCRLDVRNLWTGAHPSSLDGDIAAHDTEIWRVHPASGCSMPTRTGTVTLTANIREHDHGFDGYTRCLSAAGVVEGCAGTPAEAWTVTAQGALQSAGRCLAVVDDKPVMQACSGGKDQHWQYTLVGNLVSDGHQCLSGGGLDLSRTDLSLQSCGHNQPDQIWSLPN